MNVGIINVAHFDSNSVRIMLYVFFLVCDFLHWIVNLCENTFFSSLVLQLYLFAFNCLINTPFNVFFIFTAESAGAGYVICWDNVQKMVQRGHHSTDKKDTFKLWALAFAAVNRISFHELSTESHTVPAKHLDLNTFIPSKHDWDTLKDRMVVLATRMLVTSGLSHIISLGEDAVTWHIPHEYSAESTCKTQLVSFVIFPHIWCSTVFGK